MRKKGYKNIHELSRALGYSHSEKLQRLIRDPKNNPSFEIISDLTNRFEDLNANWLLTGKGKPFESFPTTSDQLVLEDSEKYETASQIYVLNAKAVSQWLTKQDNEFYKSFPSFTISEIIHRSGEYVMVQVADDFMKPTLNWNSWIICRKILPEEIVEKKIYVVLLRSKNQDTIIHRISFTGDDKKIVLEYDNAAYPPQKISVKEVIEIFIMEYYFTAEFEPKDQGLASSLQQLKKDIEKIKKDIRFKR
ncbi:MAG: S24/S26 family peptidase [Chitinophagales bacterium]|nr:S24/S26 family peptidase [Chitinophagales bacterium]